MKEHFYNCGVQYQRSNNSYQHDLWRSSSWQKYYLCIQRNQWMYFNWITELVNLFCDCPKNWYGAGHYCTYFCEWSKSIVLHSCMYKSGWIHLHILHSKMVHQLLIVHGIGCYSSKTHSSPSSRKYNWWRNVYQNHSSNLIILLQPALSWDLYLANKNSLSNFYFGVELEWLKVYHFHFFILHILRESHIGERISDTLKQFVTRAMKLNHGYT